MNLQRGIIPAILLGGIAAASAMYVNGRRGSNGSSRPSVDGDGSTVYVTANGRKYHTASCPLLHGTTRAISIDEAMESYEPCRACHPEMVVH